VIIYSKYIESGAILQSVSKLKPKKKEEVKEEVPIKEKPFTFKPLPKDKESPKGFFKKW